MTPPPTDEERARLAHAFDPDAFTDRKVRREVERDNAIRRTLAYQYADRVLARRAIPQTDPDHALREACQRMVDDYQTSDAHHPDHVLIRKADHDAILAAFSSTPAPPDRQKGEG